MGSFHFPLIHAAAINFRVPDSWWPYVGICWQWNHWVMSDAHSGPRGTANLCSRRGCGNVRSPRLRERLPASPHSGQSLLLSDIFIFANLAGDASCVVLICNALIAKALRNVRAIWVSRSETPAPVSGTRPSQAASLSQRSVRAPHVFCRLTQ